MNFLMVFLFGLLSRKIIRRAKKGGVEYSFLFVHPDGGQLAEIGDLLNAGRIQPVIDKVFPFQQAKEALAYLEKGSGQGEGRCPDEVMASTWALSTDGQRPHQFRTKNDLIKPQQTRSKSNGIQQNQRT